MLRPYSLRRRADRGAAGESWRFADAPTRRYTRAMIFYRHPTPDAAPGLCYGRWNIGLAPAAEAEIATACEAPPAFDYIVSSPSWRAKQLAEALAAATGKPMETDERLMEMDFGRWEGEFWDDIDRAESD
ncbi:MAG: histidine phosphatase family protein, partial [Pseudomonadota bacterium]